MTFSFCSGLYKINVSLAFSEHSFSPLKTFVAAFKIDSSPRGFTIYLCPKQPERVILNKTTNYSSPMVSSKGADNQLFPEMSESI